MSTTRPPERLSRRSVTARSAATSAHVEKSWATSQTRSLAATRSVAVAVAIMGLPVQAQDEASAVPSGVGLPFAQARRVESDVEPAIHRAVHHAVELARAR